MTQQARDKPVVYRSMFDTGDNISTFWKYSDTKEFDQYPVLAEGKFYVRTQKAFQEFKSCYLAFKGNFLVLTSSRKDSNKATYLEFDSFMFNLRVLAPADEHYSKKYKHSFGISTHGLETDFYAKDVAMFTNFISVMRRFCVMGDYNSRYSTVRPIGAGGYSQVFLVEDKEYQKQYAAKLIQLNPEKSMTKQKIMISNEVKILKKLNHESILKLLEVYEMDDEVCLVTEYVEGNSLFDHLIKNGKLTEQETAIVMKQLLITLHYLEDQGVLHRDIKPENILFNNDAMGKIKTKLIDFGLATLYSERDRIKRCGTAGYTAPEVLYGSTYDFRADLYSVGIVMFLCLTGRSAFKGAKFQDLLKKNMRGNVQYKEKHWSSISPQGKDLCQQILVNNPNARISLEAALLHPWFEAVLPSDEFLDLTRFNIQAGHISIPKEIKISDIPVNQYQPSYSFSSKFYSHEINSHPSIQSRGLWGNRTQISLHSFYKNVSQEDLESETAVSLTSPTKHSRHCSLFSTKTTSLVKKESPTNRQTEEESHLKHANDLNTKSNKSLFTETLLRLQPLIQDLEEEGEDENLVSDDEESPLSQKYRQLQSQSMDPGFSFNFRKNPLERSIEKQSCQPVIKPQRP